MTPDDLDQTEGADGVAPRNLFQQERLVTELVRTWVSDNWYPLKTILTEVLIVAIQEGVAPEAMAAGVLSEIRAHYPEEQCPGDFA